MLAETISSSMISNGDREILSPSRRIVPLSFTFIPKALPGDDLVDASSSRLPSAIIAGRVSESDSNMFTNPKVGHDESVTENTSRLIPLIRTSSKVTS